MRFYLLYGASEELELTKDCQIGRRHGDLKFSDELLSGTHGKFFIDGDKLYVVDLGSSNGTFINKKQIDKNVPYELDANDVVEMGSQTFRHRAVAEVPAAAVEPEGTMIEIGGFNKEDGTMIEAALPAVGVPREAPPAKVEEVVEAAPPASPAPEAFAPHVEEATRAEHTIIEASPIPTSHTIVEPSPFPAGHTIVEALPTHVPKSEATFVESNDKTAVEIVLPPRAPAPAAKDPSPATKSAIVEVQKLVEARSKLIDLKELATQFDENKRANPAPAAKLAALKDPEAIPTQPSVVREAAAVAQEAHRTFGSKKIIIASALVIGVFAFLLTSRKHVESKVSADEEVQTQASTEEAAPPAVNEAAAPVTAPATESVATPPTPPAPVPETPAAVTKNSSTPTNDSVQQAAREEVQAEEVRSVPPRAVVVNKAKNPTVSARSVAKQNSSSTTAIKTSKKDPYGEAQLLARLAKIRAEASRTKSYRVKSALEIDAVEISSAHYKKIKLAINNKWKNSRGIASVQRSKLKKTLQMQLVAVNNREKLVRSRLAAYINGQVKTPF